MAWTKNKIKEAKNKIKEGFDKFYQEHGRYPTALEIDEYASLPSSRQIQRRFGGLQNLRKELGLDTLNFTKGSIRSQSAQYIGKRGLDFEREIRKILINKFGEVFVHEQKPFNDYAGRLDFFVYAKNNKFGIDVFFASYKHSLIGCINSKQRLYKNFADKLILLQLNPKIDQKVVDQYLSNKKNTLPSNVSVLSLNKFLKFIQTIQPLQVS